MSKRKGSYFLDERDLPDYKFGKTKRPGCKCDYNFTCRVCLEYAATRDRLERSKTNREKEAANV